jgi:iron complex transport system ATP-binding protein
LTVVRREGLVIWQGRDQSDWSAAAAATLRGFMQQQAHDRFSLTVGRLLELSVCVPGRNDPRLVLDQLDAGHLRHRDVMCLSGGERQRVALAQCAMQGAPLMLLDEPVAFQDPAHQAQVGRWLKAITSAPPEESSAPGDEGTTGRALGSIVVTAHDVNWMAGIATHVLALYGDGRWASDEAAALLTPGTLQAVYGCPWRRVGDAFIPGG